jgi:hypothetical protein
MSLQMQVIQCLEAMREDADDPTWIDRIIELISTKRIEDTNKVASLFNIIFHYMPELNKADPYYTKLYALSPYISNLDQAPRLGKKT